MIKEIVKDPLFLQQKSVLATKSDIRIGQDLLDTLSYYHASCVGLAANMIGYSKRIIVIQMGKFPLLMINPILLSQKDEFHTEEGCLSLSGTRKTKRFKSITVSFYDMQWKKQVLTLNDFPAQICQHELDHLDGILI